MEMALGVSVTPTTVHMVLVEGEKADGLTIESDKFTTNATGAALGPSVCERVSATILATQQNARSSGQQLVVCGVTVSDRAEAKDLRSSLSARAVEEVILVDELHAAAALAHAVGRAVGYSATGLLLVKRDVATLSIVDSVDRSIIEVCSAAFDHADPMAVLPEMLTRLPAREKQPHGLFIVGSDTDLAMLKSHLEAAVSLPIILPEEPDWALARGAALLAATAPRFEASTAGLAYAQDPDGENLAASTALPTGPLALADVVTKGAAVKAVAWDSAEISDEPDDAASLRERVLPVGSLAAALVVIGAVTMVVALAATIRPTVYQRPALGGQEMISSSPTAAPPPPATYQAAPAPNSPPPLMFPPVAVQPPPSPIQAPVPVNEAPRSVVAQVPAPRVQSRAAPAPEARVPTLAPVAVRPAAVDPPPAAPPIALPTVAPPAPVVPQRPVVWPQMPVLPTAPPPVQQSSGVPSLWSPPSTWVQAPPIQSPEALLPSLIRRWLPIPLSPQQTYPTQQALPPVAQTTVPLLPPIPSWPQRQIPQRQQAPVPTPTQSPAAPVLPWPQSAYGSTGYGIGGSGGVTSGGGSPDGSAPLWPQR